QDADQNLVFDDQNATQSSHITAFRNGLTKFVPQRDSPSRNRALRVVRYGRPDNAQAKAWSKTPGSSLRFPFGPQWNPGSPDHVGNGAGEQNKNGPGQDVTACH